MNAEGDTFEEEQIIGTVEMVPKKRMTHISKPPPSNKRSKRRDERNIRQALYMEKCWKPRSVKFKLHFSHFNTNAKFTKDNHSPDFVYFVQSSTMPIKWSILNGTSNVYMSKESCKYLER